MIDILFDLQVKNNLIEDLFSDSQPKAGQVVSGGDDFDDFDPRAGESNSSSSYAALGSVEAAQSLSTTSNTADDDFADFSSAFSGSGDQNSSAAVDLFGGSSEPAATGPEQAQKPTDLFGSLAGGAPPSLLASRHRFVGRRSLRPLRRWCCR